VYFLTNNQLVELVELTKKRNRILVKLPLTRYIKHLANSADFKNGTLNNHRSDLIGDRFEMPNVSYTHPLCASGRKKLQE